MVDIDKIKYYNSEYRKGTPVVSDQEYDALVEKLRKEDPNNEWFKSIEPSQVSNGRKRKLPLPMKSLNKVKSIPEVMSWLKSIGMNDDTEILVMPKFDGLSLLVNDKTGEAYSRGGSENEGQDCSAHYDIIRNGHSDLRSYLTYTFGEFIITNEQWKRHFRGKISPLTGNMYRSQRNTAAGMLNQDFPNETIKNAYFYRYGSSQELMERYKKFSSFLCDLGIYYKQPLLFSLYKASALCESELKEEFLDYRDMYPVDGLVLYINDISLWKKLGRHETSGNPVYAIAYKPADFQDTFETTVKDITWKISKAGCLKPVVNIDTVDTGDCNMENPTGYNAKFIFNNKIAEGAKVLVTRSGGVIPKILQTIEIATPYNMSMLEFKMRTCPVCGKKLEWNDSKVELCCTNPECKGIKLAKIVFFLLTCGYDNAGEETINKMFESGLDDLFKILHAEPKDLFKIDGFGTAIVNQIIANNQKIKDGVPLYTLMHASDCFKGLGEVKLKSIIEHYSYPEKDIPLLMSELWRGVMPKATNVSEKSFVEGFSNYKKFAISNGLYAIYPKIKTLNTEGIMSGHKVCFSGFRDKRLEEIVISEGGTIVSGVSKNTTDLIVESLESSSSKLQKAKDLGTVHIFARPKFVNLFDK